MAQHSLTGSIASLTTLWATDISISTKFFFIREKGSVPEQVLCPLYIPIIFALLLDLFSVVTISLDFHIIPNKSPFWSYKICKRINNNKIINLKISITKLKALFNIYIKR